MNRSNPTPLAVCLFLLLALFGAPAIGQIPPTLRASLGDNPALEARVQVGEPVEFVIQVLGVTEAERPRLTLPDGLRVIESDERISFGQSDIIHDRRVERQLASVTYSFTLVADRAGVFRLPQASVETGNTTLRTSTARLEVIEPVTPEGFSLELLAGRETLYVGQPMELTVRWTLGRSPDRPVFSGRLAPKGVRVLTPEDDRWLRDAERTHRLELFDGPGFAALNRLDNADGEQDFVLEVRRLLIADEPGRYELGPLTVRFRSQGIDAGRTPLASVAEPLTIRVLPLPEDGRPASFGGLVGRVSADAQADRAQVGVGEPVSVRLTIEAAAPSSRISPPDLSKDEAFASAFRLAEDGWSLASATPTSRTFEIGIRPRSSNVTQIPPILVGYFDPDEQTYREAVTDPIPLSVRRVREVTAADGVGAGPAELSADRSPLLDSEGGVRANFTGPEVLVNESPDPFERLPAVAWVLVLGLPPLLLAGVVALRWSRSPSREAVRRRATAFGRAKAMLRKANGADDTARAVRTYVGMRFGVEPASVTESDCRRLIAAAIPTPEGRSLGAELGSRLAACDASRYAGDEPKRSETPPTPQQVSELIETIESQFGGGERDGGAA